MKVLVSAYACEPNKGSEPGVGWNWVKGISSHADTWVITKGNNKDAIEKTLNCELAKKLHFEYVDVPDWLSFWKKGQQGVRVYYYLWQFAALIRAIKLLRYNSFDLCHHVTFVNDRVWSFLAMLPVPFIWGPIGSHPIIPKNFNINLSDFIQNRARNLLKVVFSLLDPLYWITILRAKKIICINEEVSNMVPLRMVSRERIVVESAIGVEELKCSSGFPGDTELDHRIGRKFLFVGRYVTMKGPDLAIKAFAGCVQRDSETRLTMVGEGCLFSEIKQLCERLDVADKVTFIPWVQRSEALKIYRNHDVFLFPSVEGGGMVVLEAMATGLPVVCLDYGGPGYMVTDDLGIKVSICNRKDIVNKLSEALGRILQEQQWLDPENRKKRRETVRLRYSWKTKIQFIKKLYDNVN